MSKADAIPPEPKPPVGNTRGVFVGGGSSSAKPTGSAATTTPESEQTPGVDGVPWVDDNPDAWDTLTIGGVTLPGLCKVTCSKGRKIDVKDGPGTDGSYNTDQGYQGAKISIDWKIWTADQWHARRKGLALVDPAPTKSDAKALTVGHPIFSDRNIQAIQITNVAGPDDEDGARVYKITAIEFRPPAKKAATSTPTSATGPGAKSGVNERLKKGDGLPPPKVHGGNPPSGLTYDEDGNAYNAKGNKVIGSVL